METKIEHIPDAPEWLNAFAKAEWDRIKQKAQQEGLLTSLDYSSMLMLCDSYGAYHQLANELKNESWVIDAPNGYKYPNPKTKLLNEAFARYCRLCGSMGLNPKSRTQIKAINKENTSKNDDNSQITDEINTFA